MLFTSLKEIQDHQFIGSHAFDAVAFHDIERYAADTSNNVFDRAEALRIMSDRGMGCGRDEHMTDIEVLETLEDGCYFEY